MKMKTRVQRIKKWLKKHESFSCPFIPRRSRYVPEQTLRRHCEFCEGLFNYNRNGTCPCYYFSEELVKEKAQQFVDSWDKLHKKGE